MHSPALPPTHQYIAFYLWLQKQYQADALIHLGTHGTLEWLPGRSVGLGEDDWPDALIGNMPDIYPYIVNNPGEGTQAKRRGYAVIIDHLTPPVIKPELYGDLAGLNSMIEDYRAEVRRGDTSRATALQEQITQKIKDSNIDRELGLNLNADGSVAGSVYGFAETVDRVQQYLEDLTMELVPYGLHTFGRPPEGDLLDQMADSVVAYNYESRKGSRDQIRQNLLLTTNEMANLLRALCGEYIEPGLGRDPVRVPDAMPTGRNLVSFDPRMVPDEAAWLTGKKAADQLLARYYAENDRYPETVGVVLWAVETMRTQGESVALIFRLIGVEPDWDKNGRVAKVKITPVEELGRPRIDVLVTISGLFRDTFSHTVAVLDDAFRQIALLNENTGDNLVKKHYQDMLEKLKAGGMSQDDAANLAAARIFGAAPGTYGIGVSELVKATSAWDSTQDLTDTYLARMSFVYGRNSYGVQALDAFQQILSTVDVVTQVRDSLWGVLDNDDVYQFLGGLKLAAEAASGRTVDTYIVNTRNAADPKVQSLSEFVGAELRTRLLNPKWIEGMLKEGFSGSRTISDHIANLFGVAATLGGVSDWTWQQVAETFVFDKNISSQLNPYNLQSIIGWAMEAARRDMWQADRETLQKLSDTYIRSAAQYGVVCCHHTCATW
jgi:cobaltochelatase CobN